MKKFFILSISIIIVIGLVYGYTLNRDREEENVDWCIPGNITVLNEEMGQEIPTEGGQTFEIKGNFTYKGKDVCQAEYVNEEGTLIQYFTKNQDYVKLIYKNPSGNITNEIEMNQTSIEINQTIFETNYDNISYEENYNDDNESYNDTNEENNDTN